MAKDKYSKPMLILAALIGYALASLFIFNPEAVTPWAIRLAGLIFFTKAVLNTTRIQNQSK